MNREDFIKIIPKPNNEDVIIYDLSLKDLIDVNVIEEYYKLLPIFKIAKAEIIKLKEEIDIYKDNIHQLFLFNPSWSEEKYLELLQDETKKYSMYYGNIKRKEDEIKILQKKIEVVNEKIVFQKSKEEKENEERNININKEIQENKININKYKDIIDVYKKSAKKIDEEIKNTKADLEVLKISKLQIFRGQYVCFCCGKKIKELEAGDITNKIINNIQKKETELQGLLEEKNKIKNTLNFYKDQLSKIKIELQNNSNFKRNFKKMYIKKSVEILKLEASKNEYLEKINQISQDLKNENAINSKKYLEIKNNIEKYKVSLENLRKIKNIKATVGTKISAYDRKQAKFDEIKNLLTRYLAFLKIYYKIYEQKASQYAGPKYKIKLFEIKNLDIIEILNITYNNIEYSQLSKKDKAKVDKNLLEKFSSSY